MVLSLQEAQLPSALIAVPRCVVEARHLALSAPELWEQASALAWNLGRPPVNLTLVARPRPLARWPVLTGVPAMPTCAA
ncbi:hypothetical protein Rmet_6400 (plasmid) [Cupriavidus metallidurans CH34]|uniref:Uncharacterized protein n=1 Tax=Cupriavidus metallidurans (strain ATCC 43123 / DSM 2839 / NBRC 102507 / CH34) TaxID=266264 RepID=D3DYJ8_CUPMC|nr:hypothetical protein Rmet_6400 [Cupriavidus metallidurans CH34]